MATRESLVTAPSGEPVTATELRTHLRITTNDEDVYLRELITLARTHLEQITWRAFLTQTWDYWWNDFNVEPLKIPRPPLSSVTHVKYYDSDEVLQTLSTDTWENAERDGYGIVRRKYDQDWPMLRGYYDDVNLRAVCGYGDADDVPPNLKHAIKLLAGHWFENREDTADVQIYPIPLGVRCLIAPYQAKEYCQT